MGTANTRWGSWLIAVGLLFGPSQASAAAPGDAETLKQLSAEWMQAIARKDEPALQALMAPEYALMLPGAPSETTPRAEWIGNAINRDWSGFRYEHIDVRLHGEHATVSSKLYFRVSPIPFELDSGIVDTWSKRDGRWLVTGRYLGESEFALRLRFIAGLALALLAWGIVALFGALQRRKAARV